MKELIEQLERATGPSRKLDEAIERAVIKPPFPLATAPYTASVDAALSLVPVGYHADIKAAPHRKGATALVWHETEANGHGDGAIHAIALCIAALKARNGGA